MRSPGRVEGRARRHGGMQLRRQVRPRPYRPRTSDVPDFSSWPIATTQPRSHFFHASPQDTRARAGARPGARADASCSPRRLPTPESIRALASLFGGTAGCSTTPSWRWCACRGVSSRRACTRLPGAHAGGVRRRWRTCMRAAARPERRGHREDAHGEGGAARIRVRGVRPGRRRRRDQAELLEIVYETMKGNARKIASTLRAASAACALPELELRENGPSFRFPEFRTLAERVPSLLFPAQALYELMRENAKHAETALRALRARAQSEPPSSASLSAFSETPPTRTNGSRRNARGTRHAVPVVPNGHVDTRMSEVEARARCASLSAEALSAFLEEIGMDLGWTRWTRTSSRTRAAGAPSTGRASRHARRRLSVGSGGMSQRAEKTRLPRRLPHPVARDAAARARARAGGCVRGGRGLASVPGTRAARVPGRAHGARGRA